MKVFVAGAKTDGSDAVYYGTKLRGASNAKARKALKFSPAATGMAGLDTSLCDCPRSERPATVDAVRHASEVAAP